MKKKILAVIDELGGAKALGPVLLELKKNADNLDLAIFCGARAGIWLKELSVSHQIIEGPLTPERVSALFRLHKPSVLVTGASWASDAEQLFRNEAAREMVPSIAAFDFWMNYAKRFQHADYPITKAKDWVCVVDPQMAQEVYAEGFPREQISVVGHPHLDFLFSHRQKFQGSVTGPRKEGAAIFLSEEYSENYLRSLGRHPIQIVAEAFSSWLESEKINSAPFHLRLHPREHTNSFLEEALSKSQQLSRLEIRVLDPESSLLHQLGSYDFAFGYQSMGLFEASALGLTTMAIPMLKGERYPSLFSAMGYSGIKFVRLDPREIVDALSSGKANSGKNPYSGGIDKMKDFILEKSGFSGTGRV